MNGTMTSLDSVVSSPLQQAQFCFALNSPGSTHAAESMCISGDLNDFSSTNVAMRVDKGEKERDESHDNLIRQFGKSPVATKTVHHRAHLTWKHPHRWRSRWLFR
jgi:hypothetical protein